jgi:hypothetical protein
MLNPQLNPRIARASRLSASIGTKHRKVSALQILPRRACRGVEENWRKAEETEGMSGRTKGLEWIRLELLPRACAIGRAHELHPSHSRFVSLSGVSDGSVADREIPCERRFGKRLGIRIGFDRDLD